MRQWADVAVVGAGPAGARVAELLAKEGVRVVVLDPRAPWEKPCGGGLTPHAFDAVPELEEVRAFARPVSALQIESKGSAIDVPLLRPVWMVSRLDLGRWQLDRATTAGAIFRPVKVRHIGKVAGAWSLTTDAGTIRSEFLVGADGAASLVRRVTSPKLQVELAPTRVAYTCLSGPPTDRAVLRFFPRIAGYLWDFPRNTHRSVGVGVPEATWRRPRMDGEVDRYRMEGAPCRCDDVDRAGAVIGTAQHDHGDFSKVAGPDFALLGDAAGFADPLTGEGILNAMISAELLAEAWLAGEPRSYPARARRRFAREFEIARVLRRTMFETEHGVRLIQRAAASPLAWASIWFMVQMIAEHAVEVRSLGRLVLPALQAAKERVRAEAMTGDTALCHCERVSETPAHVTRCSPRPAGLGAVA